MNDDMQRIVRWVAYRETVFFNDSDYIIHMLKMRCEEIIRYAVPR